MTKVIVDLAGVKPGEYIRPGGSTAYRLPDRYRTTAFNGLLLLRQQGEVPPVIPHDIKPKQTQQVTNGNRRCLFHRTITTIGERSMTNIFSAKNIDNGDSQPTGSNGKFSCSGVSNARSCRLPGFLTKAYVYQRDAKVQ